MSTKAPDESHAPPLASSSNITFTKGSKLRFCLLAARNFGGSINKSRVLHPKGGKELYNYS
ncbi:hypothetical protein TRIUR3_22011 [Triticum urartu]|uniref:Uncharacterized protein n=1 Tax=Triticum urartu TaxID=4572 RepID=M7ZI47_TRIUA|nr:hypothetical protein TRIUR3_22011 [Triticum urartu]